MQKIKNKNKKAARVLTSVINKRNFYPKSKRSLSTVVATLIILLLSITAITIIWTAVKNLISPEMLLAPKSCIDFQINSPYELGKICYNSEKKEVELNLLKKYGKYEITDVFFIVNEEPESTEWRCGSQCQNCKLPETSSKDYFLSPIEQKPKSLTLKINNCILETKNIGEC